MSCSILEIAAGSSPVYLICVNAAYFKSPLLCIWVLIMEEDMTNPIKEHSPIKSIFGAVADWVTRYRQAVGLKRELAKCAPEEVQLPEISG